MLTSSYRSQVYLLTYFVSRNSKSIDLARTSTDWCRWKKLKGNILQEMLSWTMSSHSLTSFHLWVCKKPLSNWIPTWLSAIALRRTIFVRKMASVWQQMVAVCHESWQTFCLWVFPSIVNLHWESYFVRCCNMNLRLRSRNFVACNPHFPKHKTFSGIAYKYFI